MNKLYISGRERKVLAILLEKSEGITIQQLAKTIEVSSRTIHRDLKNTEEILGEFGLFLNKKSGVGVRIEGTVAQKQALEQVVFSTHYTDYTPEERRTVILSTLLEADEPLKLFALADELHVTIATISHDLDKIESDLSGWNLELIRRRGYGVKISGDEADKRSALSSLIMQHIDEVDFISLLRENIQKKSSRQFDTISNRLLGLVDRNRLYLIEKSVGDVRGSLPYELADSSYIGLVVHLALAVERLQKGDVIQFDANYMKKIEKTKEFEAAQKIIRNLEKALAMEIPVDEIGYITMHLMGAKLRGDQGYLVEESSFDAAYQAKALIRFVSKEIGRDLTGNDRLLHDLVAHLKPTIYRLEQDMRIKNPMLEEIKEDYHDLFNIIRHGVKETFPDIQFPDEEIGYLVLHFASVLLHTYEEVDLKALVICSSGIGTAKMLSKRLTQEFPDVKQVENKSLFELDQVPLDDFDLIVSTIPIEGIANKYILASPILTKPEINHLEKAVRRLKVNRKSQRRQEKQRKTTGTPSEVMGRLTNMQTYSKPILEILNCFFLEDVNVSVGLDDLLYFAGQLLAEKGLVSEPQSVFDNLVTRQETGGLGIPGTEMALYHTRTAAIRQPLFVIFSLSEPIEVEGMDGKPVGMKRMLLMLAPENADKEVFEVIGTVSSMLIQDEETTRLFEQGNEVEITHMLSDQLNQFINEKI